MSRMNNDEFIAYATRQYLQVKKTKTDVLNLYQELRQILKNYWNCDMISIGDYTDLLEVNTQLFGYFYEVVLFRGELYGKC